METPLCLNFRMIRANILGVQKFRTFTVDRLARVLKFSVMKLVFILSRQLIAKAQKHFLIWGVHWPSG